MVRFTRPRGFTLVELLVVIAIIGSLIALLFPAISAVRETARRNQCASNMKQLGTSLNNYESTNRRLPPSCTWGRGMTGTTQYEGWSWLTQILPYMDMTTVFSTLTIRKGVPWDEKDTNRKPHEAARQLIINGFLCPSYGGVRDYEGEMLKGMKGNNPTTKIKGGLTNYKAVGGLFKESLPFKIVSPTPTRPYGDDNAIFPEGCLFPAEDGVRLAEIRDGQGNTLIVTETIEDKYARWILGTEATLAAFPGKDDKADPKVGMTVKKPDNKYNYYYPEKFDGKYDNQSALIGEVKTYLDYDYKKAVNFYDDTNKIKYGPSSSHNGVTNHLFADWRVEPVKNTIDPAIYMWLVTKANDDPAIEFHNHN